MTRIMSSFLFVLMGLTPLAAQAQTMVLGQADRDLLAVYARDTWRSLDALTYPGGLSADGLRRIDGRWEVSNTTSPTDIAAYLWSVLAAEDLQLIDRAEAGKRLGQTLSTLSRLDRSHGFFFNWYDPRSGVRLKNSPEGPPIRPFLSTVDNGWLAAAFIMVGNRRPELRAEVEALLAPMNFGFFYDAYDAANPDLHPGLLLGGYWTDEHAFASFHYGMLNTEPRISSYIGIARGDLPPELYYRMYRAVPGQPVRPETPTRVYQGVSVVEGSRTYRDVRIVPSWDGSMFEALMVPLFVPESAWSPRSWGVNHPLYVKAQIEHGLRDARIGYWGVSASANPRGGYRAFGIAALGAHTDPASSSVNSAGIVTPYASFLALPFAPTESLTNLRGLEANFKAYGPYGFRDAIDVVSGEVSDRVLTLDQGMIMASIANTLDNNVLQRAFCEGAIATSIRPLIAPERFDAGIEPAIRASGEGGELRVERVRGE